MSAHGHRSHAGSQPPPLPFQNRGGSKCDLFDYKCAAKEKAAAAAE